MMLTFCSGSKFFLLLLVSSVIGRTNFHVIIKGLVTPNEYDEDSYHDYLWQCYQAPLDLNSCDEDELRGLGILSEDQLISFYEYVKRYGRLLSMDELLGIPGWDERVVGKLKYFVRVKDIRKKRRIMGRGKVVEQKICLEWVPKWAGKKDDDFGSADDICISYSVDYKRYLSMSFLVRKGIGEGFEQGYVTGSCRLIGKGWLKRVVLGGFKIRLGQGLLIGGSSWGDGGSCSIKKGSFSLSSSRSRSRNSDLKGLGLLLHDAASGFYLLGYGGLTPYYAYKRGEGLGCYFSSVPLGQGNTCYRNVRLWEGKRGVVEPLVGVCLIYEGKGKSYIGIHVMAHEYRDYLDGWSSIGRRLVGKCDENRHVYLGFFGCKRWKGVALGGELVHTVGYGCGFVVGGHIYCSGGSKYSVKLQYGSSDFYALHSGQPKSSKPYGYKSLGCSSSYWWDSRLVSHSFRVYKGKNFRLGKMVRGMSYCVVSSQEVRDYNMRISVRNKWSYNDARGGNVRINVKVPAYKLRENLLGDMTLYFSGGKSSYDAECAWGVGFGQVLRYERGNSFIKGSFVLFSVPSKVGIYMYQPNFRFPYVKRYGGQGVGGTLVYRYGSQCYIEGVWQWRFFKKGGDGFCSSHSFGIRLVYVMKE